eukprot:scaffold33595_cov95-Skeletonema_dohrnii-CCMP3373.AAC.3
MISCNPLLLYRHTVDRCPSTSQCNVCGCCEGSCSMIRQTGLRYIGISTTPSASPRAPSPLLMMDIIQSTTQLQWDYSDSNIDAALEMIKVIYDAHPEAIEHRRISSDIQRYHQQIQTFINSQLVYARQARDHGMMTTPDEMGRLPLHRALQNNVRLGSIKLLVKGNPSAIRNFDQSGVIPLHLASRHHDSAAVIQYLVGLDTTTLDAVDREGNTALHYACRGAKYETITMLLETYDAISVSRRNARKKLPIDLLWESNVVEDRDGIAYTESVFRLLKAYPEIVMDYNEDMKQPAAADATQNGKKRKFGK